MYQPRGAAAAWLAQTGRGPALPLKRRQLRPDPTGL